jgi:chromosome segregation ATPase
MAAGMSIQDIVRALNIAKNDLRSIETRFLELKRHADRLVASNQNAARTFQEFSNQMSDMKKTIDHYESVINERKQKLETITKQKDKLEACMIHLRNNSEEYSKIKDVVKKEMEGTLRDPRQILMLAFRSIVESARNDASKFYALIYNLPSENTISPDYNTNEDIYERILLNEAEDLYDNMIANELNNAIGNIMRKNDLPVNPKLN